MCGIIGLVYSDEHRCVNQALVDALTILQHRGQDAAGIVTCEKNKLHMQKSQGTVAEVFSQDTVVTLRGNIGIGHVRYPTAGGNPSSAEAQPFYTNYPFGVALAHNGNLTNTPELRELMKSAHRHVNTDSDSELLLALFSDELQRRQISILTPDDIFDAVRIVMRKCKGAYAVVVLINGIGVLAFRDPNGIRPLCFGMRKTETGLDYAVASESVAIDALDPHFKLERDVRPGEAIFISNVGKLYSKEVARREFTPCLFEYVYFARPDSILDNVPVYQARSGMGDKLAKKLLQIFPDHDIDTVIPIPETSRVAALQCAVALNVAYREGFVKNRYIARTFIMPGQELRKKTVRLKLNTIKSEFKDKVVLLVDDSIVRGTTSKELIQLARDAGAKKVYFASAAPPVRFPNVYGIDIPTRAELVAHNRTTEEICTTLGADLVVYNELADVVDAIKVLNPSILANGGRFEASCFDGEYVTKEVTMEYIEDLEHMRGSGRQGAAASTFSATSSSSSDPNDGPSRRTSASGSSVEIQISSTQASHGEGSTILVSQSEVGEMSPLNGSRKGFRGSSDKDPLALSSHSTGSCSRDSSPTHSRYSESPSDNQNDDLLISSQSLSLPSPVSSPMSTKRSVSSNSVCEGIFNNAH
jgi:amidophosphoribosyltransferase